MIDAAAWQAFGGTAAVVVLLGGVALALQRLGILRPGAAPRRGGDVAVGTAAALAERLDGLEREHAALRLEIARDCIVRADWVPVTSRVIAMLEEHSRLLARLDERTRHRAAEEENR